MTRFFAIFLISISLHGCKEDVIFNTPASKHIEEYTTQKQECDNNINQVKIQDNEIKIDNQKNTNNNSLEAKNNDNLTESFTFRSSMFDYSPYDIVLGDPESKVRVIQYTSPTCAHCAYYNMYIFPNIKKKYIDTNKIAYVIREFITNKQDKDASILSHCAGKERFLQFMNILYSTQSSWIYSSSYRDNLINIGKIGGISEEQYKKCLDDTQLVKGLVDLTIEASKSGKFPGTPAFFINGQLHKKAYSDKEISKAIDYEFEKLKNDK